MNNGSSKVKRESFKKELDKFKNLTDHVPGVIYQYRYHPDGSSYFPFASKNIYRIYEVTPDEVKNDALIAFSRIHPEDQNRVSESIRFSFENLTNWEDTFRVILPKQGLKWLNGNSKPEKLKDGSVIWHGYIKDITDKVKIEEKLKETQLRWQYALEGAEDGVWDWNLKSNHVFFSKNWKGMLDFEEHEIENHVDGWSKLVHPDDLKQVETDIKNYLDGKTDYYKNIHRLRCKSGNYKWILGRGKILERDAEGNPTRFIGTHTDISDRIEIERELELKNKELEQFNYIASHDLQEPLNSILSFAKLLERDRDNLSDIGKKSVDVISSSASRMKSFIVSLLELSRIGKQTQMDWVNISESISNVKEDLSSLISDKEATVLYLGEDLTIKAYKHELSKLFQNLIANAIKYTEKGVKPNVKINVKEKIDKYIFSVKDNGIGIQEKYFEKIFEAFKRLHSNTNEYSGTGIGLAYCKKIVELHKGEIWLESEVGKGSTFYFSIPK